MKSDRRRVIGLHLCAAGALSLACHQKPKDEAPPPKPPEVTVSQVVQRNVMDYEEFTGRTAAVEEVDVRARVRGYLKEVHFTDGAEVKAGTLLFEIDPRTFEAELKNAEGQKAQWAAKRDRAQADVKRYESLVPTGAASAQDLDKARAELGEAIAALQSADAMIERAKLDLEFSKITAPIDGQLGRALVTKGNLIQGSSAEDALLTTIVSSNPIYVYYDVDERTMLRVRDDYRKKNPEGLAPETAAAMKVPIELGLANESGFSHKGVMDFADNRVDPQTGTIRARGVLDNSKRIFKPGLFARVRLACGEAYDAVLLAETAIGTDQGNKYVLTVNDQNIVDKRFVKLGPLQDDGLRVISEGLKPGEWVVVNGLQRARPGKPVTPQKADMPTIRIGASTNSATPKVMKSQGSGG